MKLIKFITLHVSARAGVICMIGVGVHVYMYVCIIILYVCDTQKSCNGTFVVDSPFQTLAIDFSSN